MLFGELTKTEDLTVRCPTCGAGPLMRCDRVEIGGVRPQSHLERGLIGSDKSTTKATLMQLFRRVSEAEAERTLKYGFENHAHICWGTEKSSVSTYLTAQQLSGVWVSDKPLDCDDFGNTTANVLLQIDLALLESAIADYEWVQEGTTYREWLVPAEFLNAQAKVRVIDGDDAPS